MKPLMAIVVWLLIMQAILDVAPLQASIHGEAAWRILTNRTPQ